MIFDYQQTIRFKRVKVTTAAVIVKEIAMHLAKTKIRVEWYRVAEEIYRSTKDH